MVEHDPYSLLHLSTSFLPFPFPFYYLCGSISLHILISDHQNRTTTAFLQHNSFDKASPVCLLFICECVPWSIISYIEVCCVLLHVYLYYGTPLTEHIWADLIDMRIASYFNDAMRKETVFVIGDNCIKRIANK